MHTFVFFQRFLATLFDTRVNRTLKEMKMDIVFIQGLFKSELNRWLFIDALEEYFFKVHVLDTPVYLLHNSFEYLVQLATRLVACAEKDIDFRTPFLLLAASGHFGTQDVSNEMPKGGEAGVYAQTLRERLCAMSIWQGTKVWDLAFYDIVVFRRRSRPELHIGREEWMRLPSEEKQALTDAEFGIIFDVLRNIGQEMQAARAGVSTIRGFVNRMSDQTDLSYEQTGELLDLFETAPTSLAEHTDEASGVKADILFGLMDSEGSLPRAAGPIKTAMQDGRV